MANQINRRKFITLGALATSALALGNVGSSIVSDNPKRCKVISPKRRLGNMEVSAMGLGCQGFGQNMYGVPMPSREQSVEVIRKAFDYGVNFFDTAEAYGPFESERVLGEAVKPFRNEIFIATKYGWDIDQNTGQRTGGLNSNPQHIKKVVEAMLKRLRTDRIDLLYQHRADPNVPVEDVAGAVQDLMKEGKVLNWGLCEVSPETIRKAHRIQPLTAIQSEYSLFFRGREKDVIPVCEELGIGFVPWSPLGMGTLAGYVDENTKFSPNPNDDLRGIIPRFSEEAMRSNIQLINLVKKWSMKKLCTPAQFSLAWLQAQKQFIVPIPGTTKGNHLLDNIGANEISFSVEELSEFGAELDLIEIQGLRLPEMILHFSEVK